MVNGGVDDEDFGQGIEEYDRLLQDGDNQLRRIVTLRSQIADLDRSACPRPQVDEQRDIAYFSQYDHPGGANLLTDVVAFPMPFFAPSDLV
jgi:hypothetical protein